MNITQILGTKYPLIQGGMANIATGAFAAAVSNAGALGLIGAGGMDLEKLRENIHLCRSLTDKPFGVNIMLMHPQADQMAQLVIEEKVPSRHHRRRQPRPLYEGLEGSGHPGAARGAQRGFGPAHGAAGGRCRHRRRHGIRRPCGRADYNGFGAPGGPGSEHPCRGGGRYCLAVLPGSGSFCAGCLRRAGGHLPVAGR